MKRIIYSLLLFISVSTPDLFAQSKSMFGVAAGLNLAARHETPWTSGFSSYQTGTTTGALAGIEIGYYNVDIPSYVIEILYDQKGFGRRSPDYGEGFLIDYLEIPILVKIPILFKDWRPYIFAGPTFGIRFDNEGPLDIGIYGGLGITHSFHKNVDLFLQAGYAFGLVDVTPIHTSELPEGSTYYKEYSRDIRINFGVLFSLE